MLLLIVLVITSCQLAISIDKIPPDLQHDNGHCFDGTAYPVDLQDFWNDQSCYDKKGNQYKKGESLESCCRCFTLTCWTILSPDLNYESWKSYWNLTVNDEYCCQDCHGNVFPVGSVMSKVVKKDECSTTVTKKCTFLDDGKLQKAVTTVKFEYGSCCSNQTSLEPISTSILDPATCSRRECIQQKGNLYAKWNLSILHDGCDCCLYEGQLIPNGGNVSISDGVATCCDGTMMMDIITTTAAARKTLCSCSVQNQLDAVLAELAILEIELLDPNVNLLLIMPQYISLLGQKHDLTGKCKEQIDACTGTRSIRRLASCSKETLEAGFEKIEEKTKAIEDCREDVSCGTVIGELKELVKEFNCMDDADKSFMLKVFDTIKISNK